MTDSKLALIKALEQSIHNLKMRVPIGIISIDKHYEDKLIKLNSALEIMKG